MSTSRSPCSTFFVFKTFLYVFFLFDSQECPSGRVFTRGSTIVFAPCIHANKCMVITDLVYAAPKLNSSSVTNVLFVQLEDVEGVLMRIELGPPPCILRIFCLNFR